MYADLVGLLADPKLEVQHKAAEVFFDVTDNSECLDYCMQNPRKVAKPLLRLVESAEASREALAAKIEEAKGLADAGQMKKQIHAASVEALQAKHAGEFALKALVNISAVPAVRDELVSMKAPRRCAKSLEAGWLQGRGELAHFYAMVLVNLTSNLEASEDFSKDPAIVSFLVAAFIAKARPKTVEEAGGNDPMACIAKVLNNVCVHAEGRKSVSPACGSLISELQDRSRRADVCAVLRNLCLDSEHHQELTSSKILFHMATFLYPWEKRETEQREELSKELQELLEVEGAALTADSTVRSTCADSIVGLVQTATGRAHLRDKAGGLEILRAWENQETDSEILLKLSTVMGHLTSSADADAQLELEAQRTSPATDQADPAATGEGQ
eukprot:TRINITY_DN64865_c0_g1_i1.p1 TRINITY_DN64865_c0_g1~~TRINITY_DN64865_c0_g1_i1.p1  ORF type:complete len:422 (+),score=77.69 TRINITY_DN64865_c0_g1_i1:111-1268(+)